MCLLAFFFFLVLLRKLFFLILNFNRRWEYQLCFTRSGHTIIVFSCHCGMKITFFHLITWRNCHSIPDNTISGTKLYNSMVSFCPFHPMRFSINPKSFIGLFLLIIAYNCLYTLVYIHHEILYSLQFNLSFCQMRT